MSPILFILRLFCATRNEGLIRQLDTPAIKHHCSIYADDVILFVHPDAAEARAVKAISLTSSETHQASGPTSANALPL